ncbi:estradiol 17-beta-dehydrogenase 2-like [Stegodyphus dumicola]|uniref:estradiol 17-beta-dehydrogenase 2-like n=1 Tax=Stegodyphus dumicola TaxID=202533 RepID=UPI0015B25880|nr:estradiol 17-beta-dehydrogenase 2-like [Stegodyphus dumicola]
MCPDHALGCDSGFGHYLAKRLDSRGFLVFACCLFPMGEGAIELQNSCSKRLHVLELDVTNDDSVKKALMYVKENLNTSDLWAIVNNAGIYKGSDAELASMKDYEDTMAVNVLGMVRVTKAFLPLLRQSRGRVVNLTSLACQLVGKHLTPYIMSKHAAQAFTECLALEMEIWQIKVISVQPEFFRTGLTNNEMAGRQLQLTFQNLQSVVKNAYGSDYLDDLRYLVESVFRDSSPKIDIVIDDLESAVSLKDPDSIYVCNSNFIHAISFYVYIRLPRSFQSFLQEMYIALFYKRFRQPKSSNNNISNSR